jgi:hypothetical protein
MNIWPKLTGFIALMTTTLLPQPSLAQAPPTDTNGHWARQCIEYLSRQGIMTPFPDGSFRPSLPMTRSDFATILARAFPESPFIRTYQDNTYADVSDTNWAIMPIRYTYETNFLSGFPVGTFAPQENVLRLHVVLAIASGLNAYFPSQSAETILRQSFNDADQIPPYARDVVAAAIEDRLVVSFPSVRQFSPQQVASRGEIAASLCQAQGSLGLVPLNYVVGNPAARPPSFFNRPPLQNLPF